MKYFLVPAEGLDKDLEDAKSGLRYMHTRGTGSDKHRGEIEERIRLLEMITKCKSIEVSSEQT